MRWLATPRGLLFRFGMGFCVRALFVGFLAQNNVRILVVLCNVPTLTLLPKSFVSYLFSRMLSGGFCKVCVLFDFFFLEMLL